MHLKTTIKFEGFEGKSMVEQHRMVHTILKKEIGNDTYPPNPIIRSGFSFLKIKIDLVIEKRIIIKEKIFLKKLLFDGVSVFMMHDLNRAWFFKKVFPLISVTNKTSYPLFEKYFIKLIAGNI